MSKQFTKQVAEAIVIAAVPIAVAMLVQRPELRQILAMRAAHYARLFCQAQADFWQTMATTAASAYNRARM